MIFEGAPFDRTMVLDFETAWCTKSGYTLSKMTTEEYVRDSRFKAWGVGWKYFGDTKPAKWVPRKDLPAFFASIDWSRTAVLAHNCLTGDHEVRTRNGWVRLDALQEGEDVLQWDPVTEALTYTPAVIVRQSYTGKMYEWDTTYHKGIYTPNHRMYYTTPAIRDWRVASAADVSCFGQNNIYVPTAGVYAPEQPIDMSELEARVLEMIRADGNVTEAYAARFKFKRADKIARCRELLDLFSVSYRIKTYATGVTTIVTHACAQIKRLCRMLGAGKTKSYGAWVLQLPVQARLALLDELKYWDGSVATSGGNAQTCAHSAKKDDVYWISELALLTGKSAKTHFDLQNARGFSRPDSQIHKVCVRVKNRAKLVRKPREIHHSGHVFCLQTPTKAFLVRRNGAVWATGNSVFDITILSWIYKVRPAFILDSLSMARALRGAEAGNSLDKLASVFGLPAKGTALSVSNGYLDELPAPIESQIAPYCCHDVYLAEQIFSKLCMNVDPATGDPRGLFPIKELRLIDLTLRMYTQPVLELDGELLAKAIEEERTKRQGLLLRLGVQESDLASNLKFAELLRSLGVDPPMKTSRTTGKPALALAKNDAMFQALLNGAREDVASLCEARLLVKSTLERTRAQRFLDISGRGALPFPLKYYAAHTGRYGGSEAINAQNLKRGSFLRQAIYAPDGKLLVVGDLSQIEVRVLAWLADYDDVLSIFRSAGEDVYAAFGAGMFGIPGMTKESHPVHRQSSKSALLGAGYSLSWATFAAQLLVGFLGAPPVRYDKTFAKQLGVTAEDVAKFVAYEPNLVRMSGIPHSCTDEELLVHCLAAKAIIDKYRAAAWPVVAFWRFCDSMLERCLHGGEEVEYKCLTFRKEEILLPNGMCLRYPGLQKTSDGYVYGSKRLFGAKLVENISQALARIIMTDGMLRVSKRYFVAGTVHDELIAVVRESEAQEAADWVKQQMVKEPPWMPGIPLDAGVDFGKRYGEVK